MWSITSLKDNFEYVIINIKDYLDSETGAYYNTIYLFYNNYLKNDSVCKIKAIYPDGTEYVLKTPLLTKQEVLNIFAILFKA
jgi:hypothetical protein